MKKTGLLIALSLLSLSIWAQDIFYEYHPHNKNVKFVSSNLPIVIIDLYQEIKYKGSTERTGAIITILDRKDGGKNLMSDEYGYPDFDRNIYNYDGIVGIKYRGNTSFSLSDKKPFSIHTLDNQGNKKEANILGMGAHHDWVLMAPYADKSLMRDVLTFELQKGYFDYTPKARYCELVIEGVYQGVYIIVARARRGDNRIDLPKPKAEGDALTGGYQLYIDRVDASNGGFYSKYVNQTSTGDMPAKYRSHFQYIYPDLEDYTPAQLDYIHTFINDLEESLLDENFADPELGRYRDYIDVTSAIDYILTQEYTYNADGYRLSTPIYKYNDSKDPRLKFSIWDFNIAYGNVDYLWDRKSFSGWAYLVNDRILAQGHENSAPFWFQRMMKDESFVEELRQRWCQYRSTTHSDKSVTRKIDSLSKLLDDAQYRNFLAWRILGNYVWPDPDVKDTWEEEVEEMKTFLLNRMGWMDRELNVFQIQTIENGTAMPSTAYEGMTITLTARAPEENMEFLYWEGADAGLLEDRYSPTTRFVTDGSSVNISAVFNALPPIVDTENASVKQQFIYPKIGRAHV